MLPRRHRLRHRADFERLRRKGRKIHHPLAVLVFCPNHHLHSRFAFSAGKRIGNAVQRNRAKRLLREVVRQRLHCLKPGWDCLFIARVATVEATFPDLSVAIDDLLGRAGILEISP